MLTKAHVFVICVAQFGVLSFSPDEKKVLYVAEKKKQKTASFFESKSKSFAVVMLYVHACVVCLKYWCIPDAFPASHQFREGRKARFK